MNNRLTNSSNNPHVAAPDPKDYKLIHLFYAFLTWLPWIWMLMVTIFVLLVTLKQGQLPYYNHPDPKQAGAISLLYYPIVGVVPPLFLSPFVWAFLAFIAKQRKIPLQVNLWQKVVYLAGMLLFFFIVVGDIGGFMYWLAD